MPHAPPLGALLRRYAAGSALACEPVEQGLLNRGYRLRTTRGRYFLKHHFDPDTADPAAIERRHRATQRLAALGVPVAKSSSDVELAIDVLDARNSQTITSYAKAAHQDRSYWVYRYQDFTAGSDRDTDSAFREVVGALQTAIIADRERIVAAVKSP